MCTATHAARTHGAEPHSSRGVWVIFWHYNCALCFHRSFAGNSETYWSDEMCPGSNEDLAVHCPYNRLVPPYMVL